jgi:hypothetical protein
MSVDLTHDVAVDSATSNEIVEPAIQSPETPIGVLPDSTGPVEHRAHHVENWLTVDEVFQKETASRQHPDQNLKELLSLRKVPRDRIPVVDIRR